MGNFQTEGYSINRPIAAITVAILACLAALPSSALADSPDCPTFEIIGARGTDEPAEASGMGAMTFSFANKMADLIDPIPNAGTFKVVELSGVDYPAAAFWESENPGGTPYQGKIPKNFFDSVQLGAVNLKNEMSLKSTTCPDTQYILAGYSQGAAVVRTALQLLAADGEDDVIDQVSGIATFGDPYFDPKDKTANYGTFSPSRNGLFGPVRNGLSGPVVNWEDLTDAPVISVCVEWDFACQTRTSSTLLSFFGTPVYDLWPIKAWANEANNGRFFAEHESYDDKGYTASAAYQLGTRMGISFPEPAWGESSPVDVVIVVDSTGNAGGAVSLLQGDAAEFVELVTDNVNDSRVAVVDFKSGGEVTTDNPYAVNIANDFSHDGQDAIDALQDISQGGRTTGALYSAVNTIDEMSWRPGVRKITLTLTGSRACASQYCTSESGSGILYPVYTDRHRPANLRAAGVYTKDNEYFFETAGWSAIMDDRWRSRPGEYETNAYMVEELKRVFVSALTEVDEPISGISESLVGEKATFNAEEVVPFFADSPPRNLQWSYTRQPLPSDGDDGGGASASRFGIMNETEPEPELDPDPLPADMGPLYEIEFLESGIYQVTLTGYVDDVMQQWNTSVRIDELPTEAPASPLLASIVEDDAQVLAWTAGEGEPAAFYNVVDADGTVLQSLAPVATIGKNGLMDFEFTIPLDPAEEPNYSVVAVNAAGQTPATMLVRANSASYEHAFDVEGVPSGRALHLSGDSTPELAALKTKLDASNELASIGGAYNATFHSPSGVSFALDMSSVTTDITIDDGFEIDVEFGDSVDSAGRAVWETMQEGFADEFLLGGTLDVLVNGDRMRLKVEPTAETSQPGEFVIDANSTPPASTPITSFVADPANNSVSLDFSGAVDPATMPMFAEAADPLFDWSTAAISDVRTWIGNAEMTNAAALVNLTAAEGDANAPGALAFTLNGNIGGGDYRTMREFLQEGTVSFRVGTGEPNVVSMNVAKAEADSAYPAPVVAPAFVGGTTARFVEYRSSATWKPVINWGSADPGTIVYDGVFPDGSLFPDWDTGRLEGMPLEQGTFPITITATNDAGQVSRVYNIVVSANTVDTRYALNRTIVDRNQDNTVFFLLQGSDYFRSDNPNVISRLPIITQLEAEGGYINGPLDSLTITDPNGAPITVTGSFTVSMFRSNPDIIDIQSTNAVIGDNATTTLETLLAQGATISFVYDGGATNTVELGPLEIYEPGQP
ncbi:cutinase family protein [Salinibacterium sp. PAMC 21357]|uniref:cutinase family protein n=1 Tax=Salinibacterium sp. PAMC 21357 TaxID=1112215 RepID=UPI000288C3C2|nr:cutinase family protein [Salinibacterium sp. PAMC 21357]